MGWGEGGNVKICLQLEQSLFNMMLTQNKMYKFSPALNSASFFILTSNGL